LKYNFKKVAKVVVVRYGIEPQTQVFSGLRFLGPVYWAPAKSSFLIFER